MKYEVLDLFCGAGGLSLGFEKANFKIIGGIDFDLVAINTHEINFKDSINICGDITKISDLDIIQNFTNVDVIIGGPPCQGFSSANMWQKHQVDERNELFFEFIRFITLLKPKAFVIENVRGIMTKNEGYAKKKIYEILGDLGYNVNSDVLVASDYGVPQKRVRAFFVGIRNDLSRRFEFSSIKKKPLVTVKEAISDLYFLNQFDLAHKVIISKPESSYQVLMRNKSIDLVTNHDVRFPNEVVQNRMSFVPQGGNWKDVPSDLWPTERNNRHSSAYRRLHEKDLSVTIDTGHMNYFHPKFNRVPTVRESARIQSFPDDFFFAGNLGAQFRQVGNAVPPLLAQAIAESLYELIVEKEK